jgi:hypothetical protein
VGGVPSCGAAGVPSSPHSRWNANPGISAGVTASTRSSLTNTDVPSAFTPVTTRLMAMARVCRATRGQVGSGHPLKVCRHAAR